MKTIRGQCTKGISYHNVASEKCMLSKKKKKYDVASSVKIGSFVQAPVSVGVSWTFPNYSC